ncbi:hypothetical protein ATKI12_3429 [Kitasatospora sp. Ki12]
MRFGVPPRCPDTPAVCRGDRPTACQDAAVTDLTDLPGMTDPSGTTDPRGAADPTVRPAER